MRHASTAHECSCWMNECARSECECECLLVCVCVCYPRTCWLHSRVATANPAPLPHCPPACSLLHLPTLLGLFLLLCFFLYDDRLPISWQAQRVIGRVSRAKSLNSCLTSSLGTAGAAGVLWLWPEDYEKALRLTRKSSLPCHICILCCFFFFWGCGELWLVL